MTTAQWFLFVGGLLLIMGVTPTLLKRLPSTPAMLYLAVGLLMDPTVLGAFSFNLMSRACMLQGIGPTLAALLEGVMSNGRAARLQSAAR